MVNICLMTIFTLLFGILTWRRFEWGIFGLFLLLPTYLIRFQIGPIPSTVLEIMVLLVVAVYFFKNKIWKTLFSLIKNFYREHTLLFWAIVLFVLGASISIFTAVDFKKALGEWRAFYIEPLLLFFVLSWYVQSLSSERKKETIQKYVLLPLILCALATSLLAIYQHFTGWLVPSSFWANRNTYRVTAWYGFPNAVGLFLAPIIPLALLLVKENWKKTKVLSALGIVTVLCSLLAIVFAKGSGPLLGVGAGIGIFLLASKKTRFPVLALGIVGLIGLFFLPSNNTIKQELLAQNYSGKLRRDIWSETIQLLTERPLQGAGIASYEERIVPYRHNHWIEVFHHPHNIFLTMWVNIGLVGLIGFILTLIWFYILAIKNLSRNNLNVFLLSSMTGLLVMGLVDSPYIKNDLSILFWLLPAILLSSSSKK